MVEKSAWPFFGFLPLNINEHDTLLLLYINNILFQVQNRENPPIRTTEMLLKDIIAFLEKTREESKQKEILDEVQKASFNATKY